MTHTRTHVYKAFANPFLECEQCRRLVPRWHDSAACGCNPDEFSFWNLPCGHHAGVTSRCPSWSPVDGCCCQAHLGYVPHAAGPVDVASPEPTEPTARPNECPVGALRPVQANGDHACCWHVTGGLHCCICGAHRPVDVASEPPNPPERTTICVHGNSPATCNDFHVIDRGPVGEPLKPSAWAGVDAAGA